jgi:murein DD-endopeptidase MepM/ murein hydrolase activator NlpD
MKKMAFLLLILTAAAALAAQSRAAAPDAASAAGGDRITKTELGEETFCAIAHKPPCSIKPAVARGLFQTGLEPRFAADAKCRGIDEHYAISYAYKRERESYHGGIDMPAPFGTPIIAAAAGTVVGVYRGRGHLGMHIILRHTPDDTGLPVYVYTLYAHFERLPKFAVGDRVRMGEVLGPTGNSGADRAHKGVGQRRGSGGRNAGGGRGGQRGGFQGRRRPAIHFGVYFSASPKYAALRGIVIPPDAQWMDPVALFRGKPPFDSAAMKALPAADKRVAIPYMLADGSVHPAGSKLIWPYACTRR